MLYISLYWRKFVRLWVWRLLPGPEHHLIPSFTLLRVLIPDRYAIHHSYAYQGTDIHLQVESAKIIWDLLEDSQFAITHEDEVSIKEDEGTLRQDRYPLRTAPQFIGPQVEDLLASLETITRECNSST